MPLRLPRPPSKLIAAFEAEAQRTEAVITAIASAFDPDDLIEGAEGGLVKIPSRFWTLSALPVEDLPRGSALNRTFLDNLKIRCWRFFVGLDDGGHVECDFRDGLIVSTQYVRPGDGHWLQNLSRATLLWARTTAGTNEARLIDFPWLGVRAVRAVGPEPGVILDEAWDSGEHGAPLTDDEFIEYVLRRYSEKRAANSGLTGARAG